MNLQLAPSCHAQPAAVALGSFAIAARNAAHLSVAS
jgi:hypothetical protein